MATEGESHDLRDQIAGVAEGVANNGYAIEGLAGRIDGLDSRIDRLDSRVDGLDSRVQRLTTEVNDLRTEQSRAFANVLVVLQDVRDHTQGIPSP